MIQTTVSTFKLDWFLTSGNYQFNGNSGIFEKSGSQTNPRNIMLLIKIEDSLAKGHQFMVHPQDNMSDFQHSITDGQTMFFFDLTEHLTRYIRGAEQAFDKWKKENDCLALIIGL